MKDYFSDFLKKIQKMLKTGKKKAPGLFRGPYFMLPAFVYVSFF